MLRLRRSVTYPMRNAAKIFLHRKRPRLFGRSEKLRLVKEGTLGRSLFPDCGNSCSERTQPQEKQQWVPPCQRAVPAARRLAGSPGKTTGPGKEKGGFVALLLEERKSRDPTAWEGVWSQRVPLQWCLSCGHGFCPSQSQEGGETVPPLSHVPPAPLNTPLCRAAGWSSC